MTSIPLQGFTIVAYAGNQHNPCREISNIHLENKDGGTARVLARIPASSTRQEHYEVSVSLRSNGSEILGSSCTCPIGHRCKHIYKVLCRIAEQEPIGGPDLETRQREARRAQYVYTSQMEHASVYIAFTCQSESDSGSDFRRSYYTKENFDQEVLGVFFSKANANECAKTYVCEVLGGYNVDDDNDMSDDKNDSYDEEEFVWDGSDFGEYDGEMNAFTKVWVEQRAIEDASRR
eukprot:CAMPEP_0202505236 /NCGR_PEP_ID=MMETSP1361-20130828/46699_1 /ASSEMBLY_ACC=CAM_ASM_000849 /TAXON_ID=210615 /ORGANISM="Staurosira complex sp., Strain CCMP2646" /LENGTH=233 /DNA_ID=CAMNT_0049138925 /DNA_START=43 /DNA_END=741 /DNA_ORIENTATION=-